MGSHKTQWTHTRYTRAYTALARQIMRISLVLSILGTFQPAALNAADVGKVHIGNEFFTEGELVADFMQIAFPETLWNQDAQTNEHRNESLPGLIDWYIDQLTHKPDETKWPRGEFPWLADYMYRPNGWPRRDAIIKWSSDVTIGLGWPRYTTSTAAPTPQAEIEPEKRAFLEASIESAIPLLKEATGLQVSYVSPDDPRERQNNYAKVRIVLANSWIPRAEHLSYPYIASPDYFERWLWSGIHFESSLIHRPTIMDGYILPNSDNTPGLVVCKIRAFATGNVLRTALNECLIRAFGLPGLSNRFATSILGDWISMRKIEYLDGTTSISLGDNSASDAIPAYDLKILRLLYCKRVMPGADKNEIFNILTSQQCKLNGDK